MMKRKAMKETYLLKMKRNQRLRWKKEKIMISKQRKEIKGKILKRGITLRKKEKKRLRMKKGKLKKKKNNLQETTPKLTVLEKYHKMREKQKKL